MKPDIQCVRTHWIWVFMAFQLARPTRAVVLMVPTWPESGFSGKVAPGCGHCQAVLRWSCVNGHPTPYDLVRTVPE